MTAEQFVYWLQGFMEVGDPKSLSERETQVIKDHLKLVFDKQTPDRAVPSIYPGPMTTNPYITPNIPPNNPYTVTCTDSGISSTSTGKLIC